MSVPIWDYLNPIDEAKIRADFAAAEPTHCFCIDDFLRPEFAEAVSRSYPSYDQALELGQKVAWRLNERVKVQISDAKRFPDPVAKLNEVLASPEFLSIVSRLTGIPSLLADPTLAGAGMHVMGRSGRLDAHVDFNMLRSQKWHRRLNILVYLTPGWQDAWGGSFELWHPDLRKLEAGFSARFNRCLMFNTTESSFHAVTGIHCPRGVTRNSFAGYYYTAEPPAGWDGKFHTTVYRALPGEWWKGYVRMPAERLMVSLRKRVSGALDRVRRLRA